jgi:DNA-binding response OmpR family regulator
VSASTGELDQRMYFGSLSVLALESVPLELDLLTQVLSGFRVRNLARFTQSDAALAHLEREPADLLFVGSASDTMDEFEFIRRLRRSKETVTRTSPIILLSGHTQRANVLRARDCGASFVVAKPITPKVLYSRIVWLARDRREFIDCESYVGPNRRFQNLGPPQGMEGRRSDDLSLTIGTAVEDNMSQDEIDALLNPKSVLR